jgi:hypothetical protein
MMLGSEYISWTIYQGTDATEPRERVSPSHCAHDGANNIHATLLCVVLSRNVRMHITHVPVAPASR